MIQINNKFKMDELVYFVNDKKKAQRGNVTGISVFLHKDGSVSVYYSIEGCSSSVIESDIFSSYDALMDYIREDIIEFL